MSNPPASSSSPSSGIRKSNDSESKTVPKQRKSRNRKITAEDFKGLIAPVLACFNDDDDNTLNTSYVDKYAAWLKRENIQSICVNSITGEGPALGYTERRLQLEAWWEAANTHDLLTIVQIGGAPLPDVLQLAEHAENLGVHAVLCLPELFFKPKTMDELLGYCKIVAKKCSTRPFLYYHIPELSGVDLDMSIFCNLAEKVIPNFLGILYTSPDLEIGSKCLRPGRVVMLGSSLLFASGILMGFETFMCSFLTVRPDLGISIFRAMARDNIKLASTRQQQLNEIISFNVSRSETKQWVDSIKYWFNAEDGYQRGPRIPAGRIRSYYLKKTY